MRILLCNAPVADVAQLAEWLVTDLGVACVNLSAPVDSLYVWEGALCRDREVMMVIKVASERVTAVVEALAAKHPYDVPEVLVLGVDETLSYQPYLRWVEGEKLTALRFDRIIVWSDGLAQNTKPYERFIFVPKI